MAEVVINEMRGVVGEKRLGIGAQSPIRLTNDGGQAMAQVAGKYQELAMTGRVYHTTCVHTTAIAAGHLLGASAAANVQFILWNPDNSGYNLVLLKFGVFISSGTTPVPPVYHGFMANGTAFTTSTVINGVYNAKLGAANNNVGLVYQHVTGTANTGATAIKPVRVADLHFSAGTYANLAGSKCIEYVDGDLILIPGYTWAPLWAAAGTSMVVGHSITWYEVPIS
jgi:hypothetical protein